MDNPIIEKKNSEGNGALLYFSYFKKKEKKNRKLTPQLIQNLKFFHIHGLDAKPLNENGVRSCAILPFHLNESFTTLPK